MDDAGACILDSASAAGPPTPLDTESSEGHGGQTDSVDDAADSVAQAVHVEVHQESDMQTAHPEIGE